MKESKLSIMRMSIGIERCGGRDMVGEVQRSSLGGVRVWFEVEGSGCREHMDESLSMFRSEFAALDTDLIRTRDDGSRPFGWSPTLLVDSTER